MTISNPPAERLRLMIYRIERLEEEKRGIADDVKSVYADAKATGFDANVLRQVVRRRRLERDKRLELDALVETYETALGER